MIQCKHHKSHYCLMHQIMCGCPKENLNLIYRYSTKELERMDKLINDACKPPLASCIVLNDPDDA